MLKIKLKSCQEVADVELFSEAKTNLTGIKTRVKITHSLLGKITRDTTNARLEEEDLSVYLYPRAARDGNRTKTKTAQVKRVLSVARENRTRERYFFQFISGSFGRVRAIYHL